MTDAFSPLFVPDATVQSLHTPVLPQHVEILAREWGVFDTNAFIFIDRSISDEMGVSPAVVIDPGHGAAQWVREVESAHKVCVEKVVLTHGHIDHYRDAGELNVPVYVHSLDRYMVEQDPKQLMFGELFDAASLTVPADIRELGDSIDIAGIEFGIHHMPGHSPGHVWFRVPGLIIGGDVLFRNGVGRTDLPGSSPEDMLVTLKKVLHDFDDADVVLSGHGSSTTIGEEKRSNPYLHSV